MNASRERAEELFAHALSLPATERQNFLEQACTSDDALLGEIEALLRGHADGEFLESAAIAELSDRITGTRIGRYKLLQKIGEGGWGIVYMAEQEEPIRRRVALKVIKVGMDTREVIARFEAERQALAMMDHPNIARVFDCGATESGRPFFVMELVRGIPITQYCDDRRLAVTPRLELFISVCRAIQHAHEKGIVHRDVKPSNILITLYDGIPVSKVIDFGVAKATEARLTDKTLFTAFSQFIGTPAYMSPEQADLGTVDARSDVYSLGVLLYELLTGLTPFDPKGLTTGGIEEMRRRMREEDPTPPSQRLAAATGNVLAAAAQRRRSDPGKLISLLRGELDWIVLRCLEREPARRYPTAVALAEDIGRHLRRESVTAAPPALGRKLVRWMRRRRTALVASAAAVALAAGAGYTWFAHQRPVGSEIAPVTVSPRSVAVLPFVNLSPDPDNAFFTDGVHEDVIMTLAKIHGLKVISRTSVMVYKTQVKSLRSIAADLGVANILEGSVRRIGSRVRVTAELIDARTDQQLWANSYDRELTDIFAIQSGIALEIAGALRSNLTPNERELMSRQPTFDQEAYELYLQGRLSYDDGIDQHDRRRFEAAISFFEQAISRDPSFALAYARLALAHGEMYRWAYLDPSPARLARAESAADEAIKLAPGLAEAKLALGVIAYVGRRDWAEARRLFRDAEADLPNDEEVLTWTGDALQRLGRWDESIEYMKRSAERNPRTATGAVGQLHSLYVLRRYPQVVRIANDYQRRFPNNREIQHLSITSQFEVDGDRDAFLARIAALPPAPGDTLGLYRDFENAARRRDFAAAERALFDPRLVRIPMAGFEAEEPIELTRASFAWFVGRTEQAKTLASRAMIVLQGRTWNSAQQPWALLDQAKAEACMGNKAAAVRDAQSAWASVARTDAVDAFIMHPAIGQVMIMAGDKDGALEVLRAIMENRAGVGPQAIRWESLWSRLRGDPRFEKILNTIPK